MQAKCADSLLLRYVDVAALAHPDSELVASEGKLTPLVGTTVADGFSAFSVEKIEKEILPHTNTKTHEVKRLISINQSRET